MSPIARKITMGSALSLSLAGAAPAQNVQNDAPYSVGPTSVVASLIPLVLAGVIVFGGAGTASAATSDEDSFSMATVTASILRAAVSYGRIVADIRYGALETDSGRGAMVLRDLEIKGIGKNANCSVTLGKLEVSGLSFWGAEDARSRLDMSDLAIANNCFGPDAAMIAMVTGANAIPLETLVIDIHQVSGSGAMNIGIEARSPGIAAISGHADFDYVTFSMPDALTEIMAQSDPYSTAQPTFDANGNLIEGGLGEPKAGLRGILRAADLSVENLGLWERMKPLIPPDATSPAAMNELVTAEPGTELHNVQQAFADALQNFIAEPGRVTAELRPAQPVSFETTGWTGPEDALAVLKPVFSNALPTPPVTLIAAPDGGGDALALGLALAEGRGLPQNSRRAIEVLSPLDDNPEALLTIARLSAQTDLADAYAHAQKAAALGSRGAPAALDRIEARLPTVDLLAAQAPADTALPAEVFASVPALRSAAIAYAEGKGVPRSYVLARRLAASAAAAGDGQAISLIARLDGRFGADADWIAARDAAADLAMQDWTGQQLAARFAAQ